MSMYNMIFGENQMATVLLEMLGLSRERVPRYRDCYWNGAEIAIYTRTGGGNRDFYESEGSCRDNYPEDFVKPEDDAAWSPPCGPWNDDLRALSTFLRDEDDDFDSTYATFFFSAPNEFKQALIALAAEDATPAQRWDTFLAKLPTADPATDPQVARVLGVMAPLMKKIADALDAKPSP
jgi:hypothetical protein